MACSACIRNPAATAGLATTNFFPSFVKLFKPSQLRRTLEAPRYVCVAVCCFHDHPRRPYGWLPLIFCAFCASLWLDVFSLDRIHHMTCDKRPSNRLFKPTTKDRQ